MNRLRDSELEERFPVTLIVRLVVDQHGQLINGELMDATYTFRQHFLGRDGLTDAVDAWLIRQEEGGANRP